ncbi:MAG TPA: tetratricopeptide repeat protein [Candidatus Acidoferrum sp.]|jgi:TolB-like protein/DNA-binding winged helix-turn-helix (wHTH) protein/Tfp pilus assembly protein PilF|nr:tetratricopeptide repeat protein [Candidatus Acidoferrum sp.]
MAPENGVQPRIIRFATFAVDMQTRELRKSGLKLKLHGQPFEVLAMLLEKPGELVGREQLRERLWPTDTFVDFDHGVNTAINRLREALGDSADNPRFIETLPRRGYRFIAPVESSAPPAQAAPPVSSTVPETLAVPAAEAVIPSGKRKKFAWLLAALLVGLLVAANVGDLRHRLFGGQPRTPIQSIAVLPLVNLSNDVNQDYFADGMTEALTTDLGKISALRVISRTSVMQYKGTKKPLPEIARELQVDALVEGTVLRSGNHMRITANLVQASPERHLWAESYENEVGDILNVQTQVAQTVAREIQVKLTPAEQKLLSNTRPVNPEAHDDYLRGRYLCSKDTREGLDKSIPYFQRAIQVAPDDPLGYAGLAECYSVMPWAGDMFANDLTAKDALPVARDAALRALQLDPSLAEAHTALGKIRMVLEWDWAGAESEFKRAIELNPSYAAGHTWYAHYLVAVGRYDEGAVEAKRSLELDPLSQFTRDLAEWACYLARHYDLAIQQSRRSLELSPESPWAHFDLGQTYEQTGRSDEAIQEYLKAEELFGMSQNRLAELRNAYHQSGAKGYWRKSLEFCELAIRQPRKFASVSGFGHCDYMQYVDAAAIEVRIGNYDAAFADLERAYTSHDAYILYLNADTGWNPIRSDPRFRDLTRRMGLAH